MLDRRTFVGGMGIVVARPRVARTLPIQRSNDQAVLAAIDAMQSALMDARGKLIEANAAAGMVRFKLLFEMWEHLETARAIDDDTLSGEVETQWDEALPHIPERPGA